MSTVLKKGYVNVGEKLFLKEKNVKDVNQHFEFV